MNTKPLAMALVPAVMLLALGAGTAHAQPDRKAQAKSAAKTKAAAKQRKAAMKAPAKAKAPAGPSVTDAKRFLAQTEARFDRLNAEQARADWVGANFITDDTEAIAAYFGELQLDAAGQAALAARRFNDPGLASSLSNTDARKLKLLQLTLMLSDPKERAAYAAARAALTGAYGKAKYCPTDGRPCMPLGELEKILATSRDPAKLLDAWSGWHAQSPAYKGRYADFVQLSNQGAREMGYADTGALWRSGYDMPPGEFAFEMERLWLQVKPLYEALHEYARYKLRAAYGPDVVPLTGPIPAHLFGNMWSQTWDNIYPLLQPRTGTGNGAAGFDLTKVLEQRKTTPKQMTEYAERFYTSLGMPKLPATFWERSLLAKPRDRDVVCHASAWTIDGQDDVRIKMCINPTAEDFAVIHHELGHVYYFLAYRDQPVLFRNGANDGFHEAIGDTVALSITPAYLKRIGLMNEDPDPNAQMGELLRRALSKVAVLPWAYMVDRWRWDVYAGRTQPADYDRSWWQLREEYMGIRRPVPAPPNGFDAGAKYHVPADVPYARYFLAHLLQFQFHRALCREAGHEGPLHECSIYGNQKAGRKLQAMLEMGASKPWPEALKAISGEDRIDGGALLEYFAPLKTWLDEQNRLLATQQKW